MWPHHVMKLAAVAKQVSIKEQRPRSSRRNLSVRQKASPGQSWREQRSGRGQAGDGRGTREWVELSGRPERVE